MARLEPYVRDLALEICGRKKEGVNVCPGEENCQKWESARGKTHEEKERNACKPCELFPTKPKEAQVQIAGLKRIVHTANMARMERNSGGLKKKNIGSVLNLAEYTALLLLDESIERSRDADFRTLVYHTELILGWLGFKKQ